MPYWNIRSILDVTERTAISHQKRGTPMAIPASTVAPDRINRNDPRVTPITIPKRRNRRKNTTALEAARMLRTIATLIEQTSDNPYRVAAYRRAAATLAESDQDLHTLLVEGRHGVELDLPGLGERMRLKLGELLVTGQMGFTVELRPTLPPAARALLAVRTIGPRTALRLASELGVRSIEDVVLAARAGHIRRLDGFGPRREQQILTAAEAALGADRLAALDRRKRDPKTTPAPIPLRKPAQLPLREAA